MARAIAVELRVCGGTDDYSYTRMKRGVDIRALYAHNCD